MQFVVAANWKMYKSPREAVEFLKSFIPKANLPAHRKLIFFVPAIDLWVVQELLRSTEIGWGAQNCYFTEEGAFTGENSPKVLSEIGTPYTLVGHSERRTLFGETDEHTSKKVQILHKFGITPMLCVGETLQEREAGKTEEVIRRQLKVGLSLREPNKEFLIAYEPVWAIGTGKVATTAQAVEAHKILRDELKKIGGEKLSQKSILYGGSVKPDNAPELASQSEINGFLVGGASLKVDSFLDLAQIKV